RAAPAGADATVDSGAATDAGADAAAVASLPLRRGYYVASDTPCEQASMASVVLVRRDGISGSRDACAFIDIVRQAPDRYRVTQSCSAIMAPEAAEASVVTYTLSGDSAFVSLSEDGWEHSARHCEQSAMSE